MNFYQRVFLVVSRIPQGKVATYGQVAIYCGYPRNARQVGFALNRKLPPLAPAHRVVNSQGYLSGAKAFATPDTQRLLLESEGIEVKDGRVDLKRYRWICSGEELDELKKTFLE